MSALAARAADGPTVATSAPPTRYPVKMAASAVSWVTVIAAPSNCGGVSCGRRAERAASKGGVAHPASTTSTTSTGAGSGTRAMAKAVNRTRSAATITLRRENRSVTETRSWPGPNQPTMDAAVTNPTRVALCVRW